MIKEDNDIDQYLVDEKFESFDDLEQLFDDLLDYEFIGNIK